MKTRWEVEFRFGGVSRLVVWELLGAVFPRVESWTLSGDDAFRGVVGLTADEVVGRGLVHGALRAAGPRGDGLVVDSRWWRLDREPDEEVLDSGEEQRRTSLVAASGRCWNCGRSGQSWRKGLGWCCPHCGAVPGAFPCPCGGYRRSGERCRHCGAVPGPEGPCVSRLDGHRKHSCLREDCAVCQGGLFFCEVCGGAEGDLPRDCPGARMGAEDRAAVAAGLLDFRDGAWCPGRASGARAGGGGTAHGEAG